MVQISQVLFGVTTFYYTINLIAAYKKEGSHQFWANKWNWADIATVLLSLFALTLYLLLSFVLVADMKIRVRQNLPTIILDLDNQTIIFKVVSIAL